MSAKWIRSKQWDDRHIPGWAWPVRFLLRTFSAIPTAVVLLSLVVVYATLASVPIGLLALAPTYTVYGLVLVGTVLLIAGTPAAAWWRLTRDRVGLGPRFAVGLVLVVGLAVAALSLWSTLLWPLLRYDPAQHTGLRLFAGFVERYGATTLRRLPGMEMSELEFYSWWPLRVVLILFVLNMITATVRRIEFTFPYLGVITVHTGIVTIALGSLYYKSLKLEGDTLLLAGEPGPDGRPTPGPPQSAFYDNTRVALWVRGTDGRWEQRLITAPRYNDYALNAGSGMSAATTVGRGNPPALDAGRTLNEPVPASDQSRNTLDRDISLRIVGYAAYADPAPDYIQAPPPASGPPSPLRFVSLKGTAPGGAPDSAAHGSEYAFYFLPDQPAGRTSEFKDDNGEPVFALEYGRGIPESRWRDLAEPLPAGARHGLVIEVPSPPGGGQPYRAVHAVQPGTSLDLGNGYKVQVRELSPTPPFPLITEGYRGATSSVAILRITTPAGQSYDRYVYHRFPEISQDLLDEKNDRGMPKRRDADPAIRITYLDASIFQVYMDERERGTVRALVRLPAGSVRSFDGVKEGGTVEEVIPRSDPQNQPKVDLVFGPRWEHAERVERPQVVPEARRDKSAVGTHDRAMLAVEVAAGGWKETVWLPFTKYLNAGMGTERTVTLPDGRAMTLAFGRLIHPFPNFMLQMLDFQMLAYDHRGSPRDYQSLIRVVPTHDGSGPPPFETYEHVTQLNTPLQAPFLWSERRAYLANLFGQLASRLSPRQFKLSQAGWDSGGWARTQQMADAGQLQRPYVAFTILGVGNNPGIHIIAFGAVLVSLGIPWAFYIKPLIVRRRKAKLQAEVAAGRAGPSEGPVPRPARPVVIPAAVGQ